MAIRFLSNQTIDSTLDLTGRVKVSGNNTDQYFYEGARTGVGVTFSLYDNANNVYFNGYSGIVLRANQIGGSGGSINIRINSRHWFTSSNTFCSSNKHRIGFIFSHNIIKFYSRKI